MAIFAVGLLALSSVDRPAIDSLRHRPAIDRLRGGGKSNAVDFVTTAVVSIQVVGGAYGYADPEGNFKAFGGLPDDTPVPDVEVNMMRYCATQQLLAGATLLAGQECGQLAAECVALSGNALGVLANIAGFRESMGGNAPPAIAAWVATLAALGEARKRKLGKEAGAVGITLLGLASLQAFVQPKRCYDVYKGPKASDAALAFLSLGAANQFASTAYLAVARRAKNKGHEKGLLVALLTNAIATLKFGVLDADKAGFEEVGSFVWTAVVSLLASVVKAKSSSAAVEESD